MVKVEYRPIGVIHSGYKQKEGVPIQGALSKNSRGTVEVFKKYQRGLKGLEGFSHVILVYHFHLAKGYTLLTKPFLDDKEYGTFACRTPRRPNPIGISIVRLERITGNVLHVNDVDIIDGTPLLDIKPYVSRFDAKAKTRDGWLKEKLKNVREHKADGRYGQ
jgi:tRNA-Thr(GGU) m(6)t(6)A37 methyltransferase TsaA